MHLNFSNCCRENFCKWLIFAVKKLFKSLKKKQKYRKLLNSNEKNEKDYIFVDLHDDDSWAT